MNEIWIEASRVSVDHYDINDNPNLKHVRELDIVGLFETSWMIFNHPADKVYGYPR